jgi:2-aminoadipate transaminase
MSKYAERMQTMESTALIIKGIFGGAGDPDVISLGIGAIAKECLPIDQVREITNEIMRFDKRGPEALAYGPVQGVKDLREAICTELLAPKGVKANPDNILVLTGGLEAMNLICQLYIDAGDTILVEAPTFVHAVETFKMFQANCVSVEMDDDGMTVEDLEEKIKKHNPKMVYVIPTFHNPTGRTLSLERRQKIAELGSKYDTIILEDDPYRDIRYSGEDLLPIKAFDKTGHTILANSLSKVFSPGLRIGYIYAKDEIISKLCDAKSATNSHTSMLPQILAAEFFKRGYWPDQLKLLCDVHRERRDVMMECIDKYFPEGTKHTFPDGGLFTWVELPGGLDATELLPDAIKETNAYYVTGEGFFTDGGGLGRNCMRLSFGGVTPDKIRIATEKLGNFFKSRLK